MKIRAGLFLCKCQSIVRTWKRSGSLYYYERGPNSCIEGQDIGDGGDCNGYCHFWIDIGHPLTYAIHEAGLLPGRNHDKHVFNSNTVTERNRVSALFKLPFKINKMNSNSFLCLSLKVSLILRYACVNEWHVLCKASDEPCTGVLWCVIMTAGRPQNGSLVGVYIPTSQCQETPTIPVRGRARNGWSVWTEFSFLGQLFLVSLTIP